MTATKIFEIGQTYTTYETGEIVKVIRRSMSSLTILINGEPLQKRFKLNDDGVEFLQLSKWETVYADDVVCDEEPQDVTEMTGKQIFNTVLEAKYDIKSIRKNKDGDVVVKLDNKGEITTMCDVKTTRQLMNTSLSHQLKAQVAWTQMNNFKQIRRTSDLPTTESAIFLVKEFIQKTRIFVERLINIHGESVESAVEIGNDIISGKFVNLICDDASYLKEILTLQSRIGGLVDL